MGWVPGFEFDVFLSYARVDNATVDIDPSHGWVAQFHRHLDVALSKKVGRLDTVKIWRDTRELQGNQLFDHTIQEAIRGSAVFLALNSHGYLQSEYCNQELGWFYQKAGKDSVGLSAGDDYRIFNLLLNNIPRSVWPHEYGRTTGFPFHDATDPGRDGDPLDFSTEPFRSQLRALAEAVYETLLQIKERAAAAVDTPPAEPSERFVIYLADTSDNLSSVRKRVLNELKKSADIVVAPGVPPPFEAAPHDQKVKATLETVDLSVHLLDAFPGREVSDQEGSYYPQRQVELAIQHGKSQLIWVPQGLARDSIEDEAYATFLDRLENGPRDNARYDFQREMPSSITRQVLAKVESLKSQRQPAPFVPPNATLLDTHVKDQMHAFEVGQYLLRHNVQPYINPQEDDPGKNLNLFSERLKQVGILIIFYGAVTMDWVRARLALALQIAVAEGCPLRACGVYVAPPHKLDAGSRLSLPLVPVEWMDNTSGFNSGALDHLLERARAAGA